MMTTIRRDSSFFFIISSFALFLAAGCASSSSDNLPVPVRDAPGVPISVESVDSESTEVVSSLYTGPVNIPSIEKTDTQIESKNESQKKEQSSVPVSTEKKDDSSANSSKVSSSTVAADYSTVVLPQIHQKTWYFEDVDDGVMENAIKGSPASLLAAYASLRKTDESQYTEEERVLVYLMSTMMKYAWPSEEQKIPVLSGLPENNYTAAVDSIRQGVYDTSAGNEDFFTLVIPSLLLCSNKEKSGYFNDASKALREAYSKYPGSVLLHYLLGLLYQRQGLKSDALVEFEIAYTLDTGCYETSLAAAQSFVDAGRTSDAASISSRLSRSYPDNLDVLKLCALVSYNSGDMSSAETYVARILQREPDNVEYVLFRAKILFSKGEYIKVSSLLDAYGKVNRTNRDYLYLKANLLYTWNKNTTSAASVIQEALSRYPGDMEIMILAAKIASETGDYINGRSASDFAEEILSKEPGNKEALNIAVTEAVKEEDWNKAYSASKKLLSSDSSSASILRYVEICLSTDRITEASGYIKDLYKQNSKDESIIEYYVKVLIAEGNRTSARDVIESSLTSASSKLKSVLYYERSLLQTSSDKVLSDLRSSLTSNPRNKDSLFALYEYYMDKGDYTKAQYYLKQVYSQNPDDRTVAELKNRLDVMLGNN